MNKKLLSLRLIVFASLMLIVIYAIHLKNVNSLLTQGDECKLVEDICSFNNEAYNLRVIFLTPPIIEEELTIEFDISNGKQIKRAWIEGVNMYMGKTPVMFEDRTSSNKTSGVTFLGSCSQNIMQWQLFIEIINNTEESKVYSVLFTTHSGQD